MEVTDQQRRLLELCAIRVDGVSVDWSLVARQAQDPSGLDDLFRAGRALPRSGQPRRPFAKS